MKNAPSTSRPVSARNALLLVSTGALLAAGLAAGGCGGEPGGLDPDATTSGTTGGTGGGTGGGGEGGSAPVANKGKQLFEELEPAFVAACATCHEPGFGDTPFLAPPDRYKSVHAWPGLVTKDVSKSKFLTYSVSGGGHSGAMLDSANHKDTLFPLIKAWLDEEAAGIAAPPEEGVKSIEPFTPILGFNAMYLTALGDEFTGMAITFNANQLSESMLELTAVVVHPTASVGLHLVHPLIVVYPKGEEADPDPSDSFSNVDQLFEPAKPRPLGPGTVVLTNWRPDAKITFAFEKIEIYTGASEPDPTGGCKDVNAFIASAQGPLGNCTGCHGGGNNQAKNAVDMSQLSTDAAAACGQVLNRVVPADPPSSQIFVVTDPSGNAGHPFKFGGNQANFNNFRNSVTQWVQAEQ